MGPICGPLSLTTSLNLNDEDGVIMIPIDNANGVLLVDALIVSNLVPNQITPQI